jgi:hypothetical protein
MMLERRMHPGLVDLLNSTAPPDGRASVWVLFQRGDCFASRWKIEAWEAVHGEGEVRVQGWAIDSGRSRVIGTDPIESLDVTFPVLDEGGQAVVQGMAQLGIHQTPVVVFLDERGRLRRVVPGETLNSPDEVYTLAGDYGSAFPLPVDG